MSKGAKVGMVFFKWLLVPVALGFVGYTFIGPMIGTRPPEALKQIQDQVAPAETVVAPEAPSRSPAAPSKEWPEPKVDVTLQRLDGRSVRDREATRQPEQEEQTPDVTEEVPMEGAPAETPVEEQPVEPAPEEPQPLPEGPE